MKNITYIIKELKINDIFDLRFQDKLKKAQKDVYGMQAV